jgi:hypothetical protein
MIDFSYQLILQNIVNEVLMKFFVEFLPKLFGGIIILIIGWIVAIIFDKVVSFLLRKLKLDTFFERTGWNEALEKAEIHLKPSEFFGSITKWFIVVIALMAATEAVGLNQFSLLLQKLAGWIPQLIVAIAIFFVAIILADFLSKIVKASTAKMKVKNGEILASIARWGIFVFSIFAVLLQLGILPSLINALIVGIVFAFSLAFGLAFGLGGKEVAKKILEDWQKKF